MLGIINILYYNNNACTYVGPVESDQLQQATDNIKARYLRKELVKFSTEQDTWPPNPSST